MPVTIELIRLYSERAKLAEIDSYIQQAKGLAGDGNEVILTGAASVWFYLKVAHVLYGKDRKLIYRSSVIGELVIFDHSP